MRVQYNVTFAYASEYGINLRNAKYNLPDSVTTLSACEMAWDSIEGLIFRGAKKVKFYKRGEHVVLQGRQSSRSIILKDGYVSHSKMKFPLKAKKHDIFIEESLANISFYQNNSKAIDQENVNRDLMGKSVLSSYRIRNNRIINKEIRGKTRYYIQVVLEGNPVVKQNRDGSMRHTHGKGRVAGDIGTQTIGVVSQDVAILKNFAERAEKTFIDERKIYLMQRYLDRSRRAMNPDKFDAKGRHIKTCSPWKISNRYKKVAIKLKDGQRKAAANRKYAHNEDVNNIRALGDEFVIETMNIKALQMKSKGATINKKTGKFNNRKRFGKSILNRSPGYFIAQAKERFKATGGTVREVNTWTFKASQYDHVLNDSLKKKLSQRWHILPDGTKMQRDLYSAFLLYCSKDDFQTPDKKLCDLHFNNFKTLHDQCIQKIIDNGKVVLNSGI